MEAMISENSRVTVKELQNLQRLVRLIQSNKEIPLKSLLGGDGNIKIPRNIAIFNITSAHDCPSMKLGLCKAVEQGAKCYAIKSEFSYHPGVLPYRRRQAKLWNTISANDFAEQFLLINFSRGVKFTALRINESGDYRNQGDIDKAEEIARILALQGIKTFCYSSRSDLDFSKCKNLIVSGSNFTKKGITNIFKIVKNKKDKPKGWMICRGSCKVCKLCQIRGSKVVCLRH